MSSQFDALTNSVFDWRSHLEGAPCLRDLPDEQQRDLVATYLQEHVDEVYEVFAHLHDSEALTVAAMITGNIDGDRRREFDDSLFNAALASLSLVIDDRIDLLYERYVQEYGVFSIGGINGPPELIGWSDPYERL